MHGDTGRQPIDAPTARGDLIAGSLCLAAGLVGAFVMVPLWVYVPASVAGSLNSPAVMPLAMFSLLGLFGVGLLPGQAMSGTGGGRAAADWRRAAGTVGVCGVYLALITLIGLPTASALSLVLALLYFGERRPLVIAVVALITPALLYLFFTRVVLIPMPDPLIPLFP